MILSLGIDIGTSGVKTATLNSEGDVISNSSIKHELQNLDNINPSPPLFPGPQTTIKRFFL